MNGTDLLVKSLRESGMPGCVDAADEIEALRERLAEDERDAARYRYILDKWPMTMGCALENCLGAYPIHCRDQADAAIDKAMGLTPPETVAGVTSPGE